MNVIKLVGVSTIDYLMYKYWCHIYSSINNFRYKTNINHGDDFGYKTNNKNIDDFMYLSKYGSFEQIKQLITQDINLNSLDSNGFAPLHWAIHYNQYEIVKLLIENGADIYLKDKAGRDALASSLYLRRNRSHLMDQYKYDDIEAAIQCIEDIRKILNLIKNQINQSRRFYLQQILIQPMKINSNTEPLLIPPEFAAMISEVTYPDNK